MDRPAAGTRADRILRRQRRAPGQGGRRRGGGGERGAHRRRHVDHHRGRRHPCRRWRRRSSGPVGTCRPPPAKGRLSSGWASPTRTPSASTWCCGAPRASGPSSSAAEQGAQSAGTVELTVQGPSAAELTTEDGGGVVAGLDRARGGQRRRGDGRDHRDGDELDRHADGRRGAVEAVDRPREPGRRGRGGVPADPALRRRRRARRGHDHGARRPGRSPPPVDSPRPTRAGRCSCRRRDRSWPSARRRPPGLRGIAWYALALGVPLTGAA